MSRATLPTAPLDLHSCVVLTPSRSPDYYLQQHYRWMATWARPTTVSSRRRALARFTRAAGVDPLTATREQVESWFESMTQSSATRCNELAHLSGFYSWAAIYEVRTEDPTRRIRRPKQPQYAPRPIPLEQVRAALESAPHRLRPILLLMVGCGLRACEIAGLGAGDIHRNEDGTGRLFVRDGKGGKQRWVPVPAAVMSSVRGLPRRGPLFVRQDGQSGPLTAHRISCLVNEYLHGVGIEETGHALRHTYATLFYDESGDIVQTSHVLGHGSIRTTQVYVKVEGKGAASAAERAMSRLVT